MKTDSKIKTTHYICDCHSELLLIDTSSYKEYGEIDLCMFQFYNVSDKHPLWDRLRQCWQIIKTGHPYSDQITLDNKKINQMIKVLQETINGKV